MIVDITSTVAMNSNNDVGIFENTLYLPKNTKQNIDAEDFLKAFEQFVHHYLRKYNNEHSPKIIERPKEDGGLEKTVIKSEKLEAWQRLRDQFRRNAINRPSQTYMYTNIFNSRAIERTIARGAFLMSKNCAPIFNQGLLNSDQRYRVHAKDSLYMLAAFLMERYAKHLGVEATSEEKHFSTAFSEAFGFKRDFDVSDAQNLKKLFGVFEQIEKSVQPKTAEIRELISAISKMLFTKSYIVGIDNFQHAWEVLINTMFDRGGYDVYAEEDMCKYSLTSEGLYPDTVIIKENTLHVIDAKYKKFKNGCLQRDTKYFTHIPNTLSSDDVIKQFLYVHNFLRPQINDTTPKMRIDMNLIFVLPAMGAGENIKVEECSYRNGDPTCKILLVHLDVLWALHVYNGIESSEDAIATEIDKIIREKQLAHEHLESRLTTIPKCCTYDDEAETKRCSTAEKKYEKFETFLSKGASGDRIDDYYKTNKISSFHTKK